MNPELHIPTDDPQEALAFCRRLADSLPSAGGGEEAAPLPEISIVAPIYNEQENIPPLYRRLVDVLEGEGLSFELIFVNDGSRDNSLTLLTELAQADNRVRVLDLARNFGHQIAISAGIEHSRGRGVIVMDADLQDPPEVLPGFIAEWKEGYEVVYAIRERRKEGPLKTLAYSIFYRMLRRIAAIDIPLDAGDFCIMDRRVVDLLIAMPEKNRFVRGIRSWVGLRQKGLAYEREARQGGQPKYTFTRLMLLALDGFISFSHTPLRIASFLGFVISVVAFLMGVFFVIKKFTVGLEPPGFAALITSLMFLSGVILLTLGVIGEYIGRIFDEVKNRPLYVLRQIIHHELMPEDEIDRPDAGSMDKP